MCSNTSSPISWSLKHVYLVVLDLLQQEQISPVAFCIRFPPMLDLLTTPFPVAMVEVVLVVPPLSMPNNKEHF